MTFYREMIQTKADIKQNERHKLYSWESTAEKLYQIYSSLVCANKRIV